MRGPAPTPSRFSSSARASTSLCAQASGPNMRAPWGAIGPSPQPPALAGVGTSPACAAAGCAWAGRCTGRGGPGLACTASSPKSPLTAPHCAWHHLTACAGCILQTWCLGQLHMAEPAFAAGEIPDSNLLCLAEQWSSTVQQGQSLGSGRATGWSSRAVCRGHGCSPSTCRKPCQTACGGQLGHTSTATKPGPVRHATFSAVSHHAGSLQQNATRFLIAPVLLSCCSPSPASDLSQESTNPVQPCSHFRSRPALTPRPAPAQRGPVAAAVQGGPQLVLSRPGLQLPAFLRWCSLHCP